MPRVHFNAITSFKSAAYAAKFVIIDVETVPRHWAFSKLVKKSKELNPKWQEKPRIKGEKKWVVTSQTKYKKDYLLSVAQKEYVDIRANQPKGTVLSLATVAFDSSDDVWIFSDLTLLSKYKHQLEKLNFLNHNASYDLLQLRKHLGFVWPANSVYCTLLAEWSLTRGLRHIKRDLWSTIQRRLGRKMQGEDLQRFNWFMYDHESHQHYPVTDVCYIFEIFKRQLFQLEKHNLTEAYFRDCEAMAGTVLECCINGMPVLQAHAKKVAATYYRKLEIIELYIKNYAGSQSFNVNSPQQLKVLINNKLGDLWEPITNVQESTLIVC